jgi:hypothetical protein
MPSDQVMLRCKQCGRPTLHVTQKPNHVLHFLLCIPTFGVWLIVWILVAASMPKPQCTVCGARNSPHQSFGLS